MEAVAISMQFLFNAQSFQYCLIQNKLATNVISVQFLFNPQENIITWGVQINKIQITEDLLYSTLCKTSGYFLHSVIFAFL